MGLALKGVARTFFIFFALCCMINGAAVAASNEKSIKTVEASCKKSCVKGDGDVAFCSSYCKCVGEEIRTAAKGTDIMAVLKKNNLQTEIANRCSGATALKFFSSSCSDECDGAPKCVAYCGCLKQQISNKRTVEQVGDFFIRLGQDEEKAKSSMKSFEKVCNQ